MPFGATPSGIFYWEIVSRWLFIPSRGGGRAGWAPLFAKFRRLCERKVIIGEYSMIAIGYN
jgi:hypothetical protein